MPHNFVQKLPSRPSSRMRRQTTTVLGNLVLLFRIPLSSSTSCTSACTPAQEIIFRYRSGMSFETRSSSFSQCPEPDSWETSSTAPSHLPVMSGQGIKARYRQSRYDVLLNNDCQFLSGNFKSSIDFIFCIRKLLVLPGQLV